MSFEDIPAVQSDSLTQPFWEACKRHELIVQQCERCGAYQYPPMEYCGACQSKALAWRTSTGVGRIHSATTVHRPQSPFFDAGYVVAIVTLDEGWHMVSNVVWCDPAEVVIGGPVKVVFTTTKSGFVLPHFRLLEADDAQS